MIRCFNSDSGRRTYGFYRSRRFNPCRMCPFPIRSSSGSSALSGASIWTGCCSGASGTWNRNWRRSKIITMGTGSIRDWPAKRLMKWPMPLRRANQPTPGNTHGSHIVTGFLTSQSLREYQFATHRLAACGKTCVVRVAME